jgi:hypothetical protein
MQYGVVDTQIPGNLGNRLLMFPGQGYRPGFEFLRVNTPFLSVLPICSSPSVVFPAYFSVYQMG